MELFRVTNFGTSSPIKYALRDDFVEPKRQISFQEIFAKEGDFPIIEVVRSPSSVLGRIDGYAYKSYERLVKMKKAGYSRKIGPADIYSFPICTGMDCGWFLSDPALVGKDWYINRDPHPQPSSETSRVVNYEILANELKRAY